MLQEIQLISGQSNCVLVSTGYSNNGPAKTTIDKRTISIAPAPEKHYITQNSELIRCKKKINFKTNPYTGPQAVSIARRNARERNRVKQVNDGFAALRRHLPAPIVAALSNGARRGAGAGKKLSKVDTLRMVVEYIRYLQQLIDDNDSDETQVENNENFCFSSENGFTYQTSPCPETAPSPVPSVSSETSSGVSSGYSVHLNYPMDRYDTPQNQPQLEPMDDEDLLDVISWWQQK